MTEENPPSIPVNVPALIVSFDAEQIGDQLSWGVIDGLQDIWQCYGKHAGSVYFETGCDLTVVLQGYGDKSNFLGFEVLDATIVSTPRSYDPPTSTASPFKGGRGATRVRDFAYFDAAPDSRANRMYMLAFSTSLKVAGTPGAWKLSMVLTVCIHYKDSNSETRVFTFDPEAQVGNGSRQPWA